MQLACWDLESNPGAIVLTALLSSDIYVVDIFTIFKILRNGLINQGSYFGHTSIPLFQVIILSSCPS
jgi:hypothetical protein